MSGDTQYTGVEWEETSIEPADEDGTPLDVEGYFDGEPTFGYENDWDDD